MDLPDRKPLVTGLEPRDRLIRRRRLLTIRREHRALDRLRVNRGRGGARNRSGETSTKQATRDHCFPPLIIIVTIVVVVAGTRHVSTGHFGVS
jgi:hypothetical protein